MAYQSRERRQELIFITDNTEYHMKGTLCTEVWDHRTGQPRCKHKAVGSQLIGYLTFQADGSWQLCVGSTPSIGQRLFFASYLVTTPVRAVTDRTLSRASVRASVGVSVAGASVATSGLRAARVRNLLEHRVS